MACSHKHDGCTAPVEPLPPGRKTYAGTCSFSRLTTARPKHEQWEYFSYWLSIKYAVLSLVDTVFGVAGAVFTLRAAEGLPLFFSGAYLFGLAKTFPLKSELYKLQISEVCSFDIHPNCPGYATWPAFVNRTGQSGGIVGIRCFRRSRILKPTGTSKSLASGSTQGNFGNFKILRS